jgi:aryl sulfotransferase
MPTMAGDDQLPTVKHLYQNHAMDAVRWNYFKPRANDIVVATTYKAGTTWAQTIVANLIFSGRLPGSIHDLSPWLEQRTRPLELVLSLLDRQTHRRAVKTHLPLDGLPFYESIKYVNVGRDPRDIFMSYWNFYRNFSPQFISLANSIPGRVGEELRPCPDDIHELWRNWMTRACFPWEHDGYPLGSVLHHAQTWWDYRHLPNILLVHFADLLADLESGIRRIARFLEISPPPEAWPTIVHNCTFAEMKKHGDELMPQLKMIVKGGGDSFFHKGTNGRWRDILSADELRPYDTAASRELTPECRSWLEQGGRY